MEPRYILAFAGGLGAGKSALTNAVAQKIGWARASFGDHVREVAHVARRDCKDRSELQRLGQALILTNPDGFVENVVKRAGNAEHIVLDGLRHVEALFTLRKKYHRATIKLVYLDAPSDVRRERYIGREHVERRLLARYEQDITEAQISRILPQYADLTIDATWPLEQQVDKVAEFARGMAELQTEVA